MGPIEDGKVLITTEQKAASSIFGILKHKKKRHSATLEQMESAIQKKRLGRVRE